MAIFKKTEFILDHAFDPKTNRHSLNGFTSVLHCHHYTTLYTQLAMDAKETELLKNTTEDAFYDFLTDYYEVHKVECYREKLELAAQCYSALGLGKMEIVYAGEDSAEIRLLKSHVDSGWIKKWGKYDAPVNYITAGFISAMLSASFKRQTRTFNVAEVESIVMGSEASCFKAVRN
jgi:hypothetical protein